MLYAREVIDLMAAFPGRQWKMHHITNHVARGRPESKQQRERYRKGVRRVIQALIECGAVEYTPARRGATALYAWKVGHAVNDPRDNKRDNNAGELVSIVCAADELTTSAVI